MADLLQQLSEQRAELPTFGKPGMSLTQILPIAQAEARRRMQKYVGDFRYDADQADSIMHRVGAWSDQNRTQLEQILKDPNSDQLPDHLQLALGVEEMAQFVLALYTMATRTLGPWVSGLVPRLVSKGSLNEPSMRADAESRLRVFSLIVKWDDDGDLEMIFRPDKAATRLAGLGMHPVMVAAIIVGVIVAVAVAAAGLYLAFAAADSIRKTATLMDKLCTAAKEEGDEQTVRLCLEYARDLLKTGLEQSDWIGKVITAAAVIGGVYVLAAYGLPAATKGYMDSKRLGEV